MIGAEAVAALSRRRVLVFGLGGVGGAAVEALARSGVGHLGIVDDDILETSNKNRQIIALETTLGESKVQVAAGRLMDINPALEVICHEKRLTADNLEDFFSDPVDYVVDAIDDVKGKVALIGFCKARDIPIISAMGTGNKFDPRQLEITDIFKTHTDPLARHLRKALKEAGIPALEVVYSREKPVKPRVEGQGPGSLVFVPAAAGIMLAYRVVMALIEGE
jgi:tRNA A37 threonylcarbamoyladenosine dehydratase